MTSNFRFIVFDYKTKEVHRFNDMDMAIDKAKELQSLVISGKTGRELFDFTRENIVESNN